jgi:hypothetical protein
VEIMARYRQATPDEPVDLPAPKPALAQHQAFIPDLDLEY